MGDRQTMEAFMRIIVALGIIVTVASANITSVSAQEPSKTSVGQESAWIVHESAAPIEGPQITATLKAVGSDATLVLRCKNQKTEAIVFPTSKSAGSIQASKILLRLPGDVETMLYPSTDGKSFYVGSPEYFLPRLSDNSTIRITTANAVTSRAADGEFKLGNFSEIREKIGKACDWPSERAQRGITPNSSGAANHPRPSTTGSGN